MNHSVPTAWKLAVYLHATYIFISLPHIWFISLFNKWTIKICLWIYITRLQYITQYILDEQLLEQEKFTTVISKYISYHYKVFYVLQFSMGIRRVTKRFFAPPDVKDLNNLIITSIVDLMSYSSYIFNTLKFLVKY